MNLEEYTPQPTDLAQLPLSLAEQWILTRLSATAAEVHQALADYKFNDAANTLYAFTWHEFCDWYIELSKDALYGDDAAAKACTRTVVFTVLEALLRLLHPLMPFITEEIWQALPGERPAASLMAASYPQAADFPVFAEGSAQMEAVMDIIRAIRNIRGEMDVPPGKQIGAVLDCRSEAAVDIVKSGETYLRALARVGELSFGVGIERPEQAATQVAGEVEILLPLSGMINLEEEEKRLQKEIAKVEKDVAMFAKKLSNEAFVAKAPPEVLEKDRGKLREAEEKLQILQQSLDRILGMSQGG
jgi:valyl-tRNA synthetase